MKKMASAILLICIIIADHGCTKQYSPDINKLMIESSLILRVDLVDKDRSVFRVVEILKNTEADFFPQKVGDIIHLSPPRGVPASTSTNSRLVFVGLRNHGNDLYDQRSYMECEIVNDSMGALNGMQLSALRERLKNK